MDIDSGSFSDWQMDIEYVKLLRSKSRDIDNKSSEAEGSRTGIGIVLSTPGPEVIKPFSCSAQLSMKF